MPGTPVIILTGGIASGKSTVAAMLAEEGGTVISADALAREVLAVGSPGWREVVDAWGAEVLTEKGEIDRRRLARRVFPLPEERRRLEAITHPRIFALLKERLAAAAQRAPFVVLEVPLYFETGRQLPADEVWVVYVDRETQLDRLIERSGLTQEEAEARLAAQRPLAEKCALADRVIDNTGTLEHTRQAVRSALAALLAERAKRSG